MQRYIAFLRGINLGKRRLPMSQLRDLFEELGFDDVETFIASGNIVFSSKVKDASQLESRIAKHLEASLGYNVDTFVRTAEEVATIGRTRVFREDGQARALRSMLDFFSRSSRLKLHGNLQPFAATRMSFV